MIILTAAEFDTLSLPEKISAYLDHSQGADKPAAEDLCKQFFALPEAEQMRIGKRITNECA